MKEGALLTTIVSFSFGASFAGFENEEDQEDLEDLYIFKYDRK